MGEGMTSLIDFASIASDATPLLSSAVTIAAGLGAMILVATICWKAFKRFTK